MSATMGKAQFSFSVSTEIPIIENGITLPNAWAGGMNFCQFNEIDLDLDGQQDLVVFDRSGDRLLPFLRTGAAGSLEYTYAPDYQKRFPELHNWVLMVDYDGDGKQDLFAQNQPGIAVYRNTSTAGTGLSFDLATPLIQRVQNGNSNTLLTNARDLPALSDIDEDGDLDLLQFDAAGSQVEYYQNQSIDLFGHADSLRFELTDLCWGGFMENGLSNSILLQVGCKGGTGTGPPLPANSRHAGSTLLALDLDGDLDKELLIGDLNASNLVMLQNGGTLINAEMTAQDPAFPGIAGVNLSVFPAGFSVDLDQDGLKDLIVSPNAVNVSENYANTWWYQNIGTTDSAIFSLQSNSAIQDQMVDVGEGAIPVLNDFDRDGLLDLFIANYGYYDNGSYRTELRRYRNTGTAQAPVFTLESANWLGLATQRNLPAYQHPTFGDLDGDGDQDFLLGGEDGKITFVENIALPGHLPIYGGTVPNWQNIDVGQYAAPLILDVDGDARLDLIIGEKDGKLNYYRNTGTPVTPDMDLISTHFGAVDMSTAQFNAGYSAPTLLEWNGERHLIVGGESGKIRRYSGLDGNLSLPFVLEDSAFGGQDHGIRAVPVVADLNADGFPDLISGNYAGGVELLGGIDPSLLSVEAALKPTLHIFPNPTTGIVSIEYEHSLPQTIRLYTLQGQLLQEKPFYHQLQWDLSSLAKGLYILQVGTVTQKIRIE